MKTDYCPRDTWGKRWFHHQSLIVCLTLWDRRGCMQKQNILSKKRKSGIQLPKSRSSTCMLLWIRKLCSFILVNSPQGCVLRCSFEAWNPGFVSLCVETYSCRCVVLFSVCCFYLCLHDGLSFFRAVNVFALSRRHTDLGGIPRTGAWTGTRA